LKPFPGGYLYGDIPLKVQLVGPVNLSHCAFSDKIKDHPFILDDVTGRKDFALASIHNPKNPFLEII
jgi:hypothetical protein